MALTFFGGCVNYQHSFHAGNFADCFKHCVQLELLRSLCEKDTPLSYLETHAGRGRYALDASTHAQPEYLQGIAKLYGQIGLPPELHRFVERIKSVNSGSLVNYPGSPLLAAMRLRSFDRLRLAELVPEQAKALSACFEKDARVRVECADGYQLLKSWLPPEAVGSRAISGPGIRSSRRALTLIDPPYERADEFKALLAALQDALKRFATGVYAVWYPIKSGRDLAPWHRGLAALNAKNVLIGELCIYPDVSNLRLNGCGMAIINAPYQFEQAMMRIAQALHPVLRCHIAARSEVRWLRSPE